MRLGFLCKNLINNIAPIDDLNGAVSRGHEFFISGDSELIVNCFGEALDPDFIRLRFTAEGIGRAVNESSMDPSTSKAYGEDAGPVITAASGIDLRSAAKF